MCASYADCYELESSTHRFTFLDPSMLIIQISQVSSPFWSMPPLLEEEEPTVIMLHLTFFSLNKLAGPTGGGIYLGKVNRNSFEKLFDCFLLSCPKASTWTKNRSFNMGGSNPIYCIYNRKHTLDAFCNEATTCL